MFILMNILNMPFERNPHSLLLKNLITVMCLKIADSSSQIGVNNTMLWIIKIITDMVTDLDDMGPSTFIDFFTDENVRKEHLNENFIPKYLDSSGNVNILKIITSYFGLNMNYRSKLLE